MKRNALLQQATQAFRAAVGKVMEERRRAGDRVAVWRDGAAQWIQPTLRMAVGEGKAAYTVRSTGKGGTHP